MAYIEMKHSYKRYKTGDVEIIANNDITFEIEKGELVIIHGFRFFFTPLAGVLFAFPYRV